LNLGPRWTDRSYHDAVCFALASVSLLMTGEVVIDTSNATFLCNPAFCRTVDYQCSNGGWYPTVLSTLCICIRGRSGFFPVGGTARNLFSPCLFGHLALLATMLLSFPDGAGAVQLPMSSGGTRHLRRLQSGGASTAFTSRLNRASSKRFREMYRHPPFVALSEAKVSEPSPSLP